MIGETIPRYIEDGPLMVLGAHPDDALIGAGGLAALAAAAGKMVFILTVTDGECGGDPSVRIAEEAAAARILGVALELGHLPDTRFELRAAMDLVGATVTRLKPSTVLVHALDDTHQDHACLSRAAISACRFVPNLLFYEGPSSRNFCPSMVVNINGVWEQKGRALLSHRSQLLRADLLDWSESASRFRAWPRYSGGRCEAFFPHHCELPGTFGLPFWGESGAISLARMEQL